MNGASAGVGGEAPLVYKAWKGNNVSGMPLFSLFPSALFFLPKFLCCWCGVDLCGLEVAT